MGEYKKILHHHAHFCWFMAKNNPAKHKGRALLTAIFMAKDRGSPMLAQHVSTIGVWAGKDGKEVKEAIKDLQALGILELQGETVVGRGLANVYEIVDITGTIPKWADLKTGVHNPPIWKNIGKPNGYKIKGGVNQDKRGGLSVEKGGTYPPQIKIINKEKKSEGIMECPSRAENLTNKEAENPDQAPRITKEAAARIMEEFGLGHARPKGSGNWKALEAMTKGKK